MWAKYKAIIYQQVVSLKDAINCALGGLKQHWQTK